MQSGPWFSVAGLHMLFPDTGEQVLCTLFADTGKDGIVMKKSNAKALVVSVLIALAVGALSGWISMDGIKAFQYLEKPPLTPPGTVFPIVWSILYILMGLSAGMVWSSGSVRRDNAIFAYAAQLFVNFWWPVLFFLLGERLIAFFWLLLLIVLVILMLLRFREIRPSAALLNLPYLLWLLFAAYLNLGVYLLNR